jgi:hypothetical protein
MNVVRRRPFVLAHRYHRFAIEDLNDMTLNITSPH